MFDIGFSEIALIAVVALVVVGPERLPRVARMAGRMLGQVQRYVNSVKSEIDREMQIEELKKLQGELNSAAHSLETSLREGVQTVESQARQIETEVQSASGELAAPEPPAPTPAAEHLATPAAPESPVPSPPEATRPVRQPLALDCDPR
ncbi:MAG: twin-arginine translocase subunit TatB [Betaproteobacteria bacterium]|nr:twin-arginine translocase subunit TatB [Betaproteobacteria bacterium]